LIWAFFIYFYGSYSLKYSKHYHNPIVYLCIDNSNKIENMSSKDNNLSNYKIEAIESADNLKVGIVVSEWNEDITATLLQGAIDTLKKHNVKDKNIHTVTVPGSYELPMGAKLLLTKYSLDTVICLGCVIKGETDHDKYINTAVASGIMNLGLMSNKPIIFGVLTPNDQQQAKDRAGGKFGNKGVEAATTALRMTQLKDVVKNEGNGAIGF